MKLIILAAGRGSRLSKYTGNLPKGMLQFNDKPLIEHNLNIFKYFGISEVVIIKGYLEEKINFDEVTYFINKDYLVTNMVESLMCAEEELNGPCIVLYSDIILDEKSVSSLLDSKSDIGVMIDVDFQEYWKSRLGNEYVNDMESLKISDNKIIDIGNQESKIEMVDGRYVGAIAFSKKGINILKDSYHFYKSEGLRNKEGNRSIENWHMTDLLQQLILDGNTVNPIRIKRGWLEFDTDEDYELYNKWLENNSIRNFINF